MTDLTFHPTTIHDPDVGAYGVSRSQLFFNRAQGDVPFFDIRPLADWEHGREFASSKNKEIALDLAIISADRANGKQLPNDLSNEGLLAHLRGLGISAYPIS
jgi:hypothetical protein